MQLQNTACRLLGCIAAVVQLVSPAETTQYHQQKPLMYSSILAKFPHVRLYSQPKYLIPASPGAKIPHFCLYKEQQ
jgi:hypothetical protein